MIEVKCTKAEYRRILDALSESGLLLNERCVLGKDEFTCPAANGKEPCLDCSECLRRNIKHIPTRTPEEEAAVNYASHAVGLDYKKPYHRHGKAFYKPYRNFYSTYVKDKTWCMLAEKGYAKFDESRIHDSGLVSFHLTRAGLDWLGKELGVIIYDYS